MKKHIAILLIGIIIGLAIPIKPITKDEKPVIVPELQYIVTPPPVENINAVAEKHTETIETYYNDDPQRVWNIIKKYSPNDATTAAILAMCDKESQFKSNAVTGWYKCANKQESELFTARIDKGLKKGTTRDDFVYTSHSTYGGYGLAQWYSWDYLWKLYDYAQQWGTSIADAEMQISYIVWYIQTENPYGLWDKLVNETDPYNAGDNMAIYYEGTSSHSYVASKAQEYYNQYAG